MLGCEISRIGSSGRGRELRRATADFALALALFWAVAVGADMRAHAVTLAATLPSAGMPAFPSDTAAPKLVTARIGHWDSGAYAPARPPKARALDLALLSLAFAGLLAGNLAFWRHLRRAYASPRRRVWRRG